MGWPFIVLKKYGPVFYEFQKEKNSTVIYHDRLRAYKSEVVPGCVTRFCLFDQSNIMDSISELDNEQEAGLAKKTEDSKPICVKVPDHDLTLGSEETPRGLQRTRVGRRNKQPYRHDL